jgi:Transposase DNA-binding/Transposase DDE domain
MEAEMAELNDPASWAQRQFGAVALGDRRLNRRAVLVGEAMARRGGCLTGVRDDSAASKAFYRLLDEDDVTFAALTEPHRLMVRHAAAACVGPVLFVQDQTYLDFTAHPATEGLGPIASPNQKGAALGRGFVAQTCLALEARDGRLLGLANLELTVRPLVSNRERGETRAQRERRRNESDVWFETLAHIGRPPADSVWISVGDRDSDCFRYFRQARDAGWHVLARLCHDRTIVELDDASGQVQHLLPHLRGLAPAAAIALAPTPKTPWRPALTLSVAWTRVRLLAPRKGPWCKAAALECWLVRAWASEPELEWLLLSTLPVDTADAATDLIAWYACRWRVEEYHKALKTGCGYEKARLRHADRLEALLGFCALVAVRLLALREDARRDPDAPATTVASPLAVALVAARRHLPCDSMTAGTFWRAVAGLGGFLGRKCDGPPGWLTLWRGWMIVCEWCWAVECATNLP